MSIDNSIQDELSNAWAELVLGEVKKAGTRELTEDEIKRVNNDFLIDDAHAYYSHVAVLENLYYYSKLGEELFNLFTPMKKERKYEYDLD